MALMTSSEFLAVTATNRLGLRFSVPHPHRDGANIIRLRPDDLPPPNGFAVEFSSAWRSIRAELVLDSFAGTLLAAMATADIQKRKTFTSVAKLMKEKGIKVHLRINENLIDPSADLPPAPWNRLELSANQLSSAPAKGEDAVTSELSELALTFLNLVVSLLPYDEAPLEDEPLLESGLPEGAKIRVTINRYERSPANRAACIAAHGAVCKACAFNFALFYGAFGDGFIVVHHTIPVSAMGGSYIVDPINDLVPLCANCHAMVHRTDPPMLVADLRVLIETRRAKELIEL